MRILFVCLGNICRSPMAEGILKEYARKNNLDWTIESAGTESYHVGQMPDRRAIKTCRNHGIDITTQRARRISKKDFEAFDHIFVLADDIFYEISHLDPGNPSRLKLLMDEVYPGKNRSVPDPWYGNEEDFESAYQLIDEACRAIIKRYAAVKTDG